MLLFSLYEYVGYAFRCRIYGFYDGARRRNGPLCFSSTRQRRGRQTHTYVISLYYCWMYCGYRLRASVSSEYQCSSSQVYLLYLYQRSSSQVYLLYLYQYSSNQVYILHLYQCSSSQVYLLYLYQCCSTKLCILIVFVSVQL